MKTTEKMTRRMSRQEKIRQAMLLISRFKREEEGGMIIFSLYCFVLMLLIAGVAVDVMRFETERTLLQNTLDTASLAATNRRQQRDPEELVRDFMETRGYDPDQVTVTIDTTTSGDMTTEDGVLLARSVKADYPLSVNTFFMPLVGIYDLGTTSSGAAQERVQNVEISLVVDMSGSMSGQKLTDLQTAASQFFEDVIDEEATEGVVSVSIVPYNHTVVVSDDLLDRLTTTQTVQISEDQIDDVYRNGADIPFTGALTEWPYNHRYSKCVRWSDDQMLTADLEGDYQDMRRIDPDVLLDMMGSYDRNSKSAGPGGSYDPPQAEGSNRRCDVTRSTILAYQTEVQPLQDHIWGMIASGNTAVDHGMKWGVALLDPMFRPLLADMITEEERPDKLADRPYDYGVADALKIVVLMTDGRNTTQYDLGTDYKRGPSRIWFSEQASRDSDPDGSSGNDDWIDLYIVEDSDGDRARAKEWYDGYFVLMPDNDSSERWLRPHWPGDRYDGAAYAEDELPDDAVQLHYAELYEDFSEYALAEWFRDDTYGDYATRNAHRSAEKSVESGSEGDRRLNGNASLAGICDVAKHNGEIRVFTLAFGSGADLSEMRDCATSDDDAYYADDGDSLSEAFSAIAGAITQLRLTQ